MGYIVGIDIGGTFTDCVALDDGGNVTSVKVPSTPPNFEEGFQNALGAVADQAGADVNSFLGDVDHVLRAGTMASRSLFVQGGCAGANGRAIKITRQRRARPAARRRIELRPARAFASTRATRRLPLRTRSSIVAAVVVA